MANRTNTPTMIPIMIANFFMLVEVVIVYDQDSLLVLLFLPIGVGLFPPWLVPLLLVPFVPLLELFVFELFPKLIGASEIEASRIETPSPTSKEPSMTFYFIKSAIYQLVFESPDAIAYSITTEPS